MFEAVNRRSKFAPEIPRASRLSRITSLEIINPEPPDQNVSRLLEEMTRTWQNDWSSL